MLAVPLLSLIMASVPAIGVDRHLPHYGYSEQEEDEGHEGGKGRGRDADRDRGREADGREISLNDAVQLVQRRYNARVVRAETVRVEGRTLYRLRLLNDDGRVWTVMVDAATGHIR